MNGWIFDNYARKIKIDIETDKKNVKKKEA